MQPIWCISELFICVPDAVRVIPLMANHRPAVRVGHPVHSVPDPIAHYPYCPGEEAGDGLQRLLDDMVAGSAGRRRPAAFLVGRLVFEAAQWI